MKKLIFAIAFFISLQSFAQQKATDSIMIKIDTTTYKYVVQLIKENIDSRTATGQTILGNILTPLSRIEFVAEKPKALPTKPKN